MASTFSSNLRIELIGNGDQSGTWGVTTNTNLGTLIEGAIAGYASVSVTSAAQALTANNGVADQSRLAMLNLTTTTTANFAVYIPPASKSYTIKNSSAYTATIYNSTVLGNTTAAGTGVTIPTGATVSVWSDGTNVQSVTYFPSITSGGNLAFTAPAARITGDFSNATTANRVMFQTSVVNGSTSVQAIPNGTGNISQLISAGSSDPANGSQARLDLRGDIGEVQVVSSKIGTGSYLPMTFYTGDAERMRIDTSGRCIIGTNLPIGSSNAAIQSLQAGSSAFSLGSSTTPASGASFAGLDFWGNDGVAYFAGGTINLRATENWSSTNHGTAIQFRVTPNGAGGTLYEAMRIDASGNVLVTNAGGGLGYGTGAGGTVTQATSKATAVTLNKPCGQITMNNAALAAGASVSFQFNNSLIAAYDVVVCNIVNFGNYTAQTYYATAGACGIRVVNISGGSLSEAITINFAIIKGATA